jgi:vacuolar-type H+-ATPase subunit H
VTAPDATGKLEDAERMVDSLVDQVRAAIVRGVALAREEAEDIWAEAETLRHSSSPSK